MDLRSKARRHAGASPKSGEAQIMNFKRFKAQLIALLVLISSVPLVFFALAVYEREAGLLRQKALSHLNSVVAQSAFVIEEFRKERTHDLNFLAQTFQYLDKRSRALHLNRLMGEHKIYRGLFMVTPQGAIVLQTGSPDMSGKNVGDRKWFISAAGGVSFLGDACLGPSGCAPDLLAAVPVRSPEGRIVGVLGAVIGFQDIANAMQSVGIGMTGEIYLLNEDGVFLTTTRLGENPAGKRLSKSRLENYFTAVGPSEFIDYRGKRVVRAYRRLPGLNWFLVGEQDSSEVLSDISSLRLMLTAFVTLLIALVAVTGSLISARMVRLLRGAYERRNELELQVIQKDKLASMGLLTAGIAHELNTPLASALLYTQMLKEEAGDAEAPFKERLGFIEEEIKRGSRIIRNLLDFSRQSRTDSAVTEVNEVLGKLLDISRKLCADRGIEVKRSLAEDIPPVKGNAGILHQVFMNIVANAVEAMENGGTLSISTRFIKAIRKVVVEVRDTGEGIPEGHLGRVFDPFFTTKSSGEGTGLGLAISYSMVKKMGGNIRVTSSCRTGTGSVVGDTGTTFIVELPIQEEPAKEQQ